MENGSTTTLRATHPAIDPPKWKRLLRSFNYKKYRLFKYIRHELFFNKQTIPYIVNTTYNLLMNYTYRKTLEIFLKSHKIHAIINHNTIANNIQTLFTMNKSQLWEDVGAIRQPNIPNAYGLC